MYQKLTILIFLTLLLILPYQAPSSPEITVAEGVIFLGVDYSNWQEEELRNWLPTLQELCYIEPLDAQHDKTNQAIIPGRSGWQLQIEENILAIISSPPNTNLQAQWLEIQPEVSLEDLPLLPIRHGNTEDQSVTFLINVAWGEEFVPGILNTLANKNIAATWFLVGIWVKANPELTRQIAETQELANHGYSDRYLTKDLSTTKMAEDLTATSNLIESLTGTRTKFFSPHKGEYNITLLEISESTNHQLILWSIDTIDWRDPSPEEIYERVLDKLHPGATILMHPRENTLRALPALVDSIQQKGYSIIPLSELLNPSPPQECP